MGTQINPSEGAILTGKSFSIGTVCRELSKCPAVAETRDRFVTIGMGGKEGVLCPFCGRWVGREGERGSCFPQKFLDPPVHANGQFLGERTYPGMLNDGLL